MAKKCSKALRKRTSDLTNKIFEDCVREVLGLQDESSEALKEAMDIVRFGTFLLFRQDHDDIVVKDMVSNRSKVDDLYQVKIAQLPTKQLNEILKSHELQGGIKRTKRTIETIISELARRTILGDTYQSDSMNDNGDIDDSRKQSKSRSKKTTTKRRKASKNR